MKFNIIIILSLLFSKLASSQSGYLVYQMSGNVFFKNDKQQVRLKIGQPLKDGASLIFDKNVTLSLICENYSLINVTKTGPYTIKHQKSWCLIQENSLTTDYFHYIWDELTKSESSPEKDRRKYMENIGGVERGVEDTLTDKELDTINYYAGDFIIKWKSGMNDLQSEIIFFDRKTGERLLFSISTADHQISIDSLVKRFGKKKQLYWNIKNAGREIGQRKMIRIWSKPMYDSFNLQLEKADINLKGTSEWYYMMGFFLESRHFIYEAYENYKKALDLNPHEKRYQLAIADFNGRFFDVVE